MATILRPLPLLVAVVIIPLFLLPKLTAGQQLSVRRYNVDDGLANATVGAIYQDQKGYLWFGTAYGLSRFDGYHFVTYTVNDGLQSNVVTSITEDSRGRLWLGTTGGIARLIDDSNEVPALSTSQLKGKKFATYHVAQTEESNAVTHLFFARDGALWCTSDQVYRAPPDVADNLTFEVAIKSENDWRAYRTFVDSHERRWFGLMTELIEDVGGQLIRYGSADGLPMKRSFSRESPTVFNEQIVGIAEDKNGQIIVANRRELFAFVPVANRVEQRGHWRRLSFALPADREIQALLADSSGQLWIGTTKGLIRYEVDGKASYMTAQGLGTTWVLTLFEDRQGNLWVGSRDGGVHKAEGDFIVSYTTADGLPDDDVHSLLVGPLGGVYVTTRGGVVLIDSGKVQLIPASQSSSSSNPVRSIINDSKGNYWVTSDGLYRFPGPTLDLRSGKKIGVPDGAPAISPLFGTGLYGDLSGNIWCGALRDPALYVLAGNQSGRPVFRRIALERTPQGRTLEALHCAIADRTGEMWFGWQADLGRYRNGRMELIVPPTGLREILPRNFFIDSRGWLWIGQQDEGALMTRDPTAEHPEFVVYATRAAVTIGNVNGIAEDNMGRIYLSTGKGLDRLDPLTGAIHHFTAAEGMTSAATGQVIRDQQGNIWVATNVGVKRLNPRAERALTQPPVYFSHVQIAGEDLPLPESGTQQIQHLELPASRNNLLVEFAGLDFQAGDELRYQYKLEGVDHDWSKPSAQRTLNFARLAPGAYRLLVRTVNAEGHANEHPSLMEFRILPPLWQRWWFISFSVLATATLLLLAYRYRIARLMELESTRLRIARDLHDEVGSGLGSIGILSSLAAEDDLDESQRRTIVKKITATSGELGATLGEIVWALRNESETLESLAYHLTERAGRLFPSGSPKFTSNFPTAWPAVKLSLPVRRNLQLISIEALHNVARHSQANHVTLIIRPAGRRWQLTITDDGKGFEDAPEGNGGLGMGLKNMRRRAAEMGAGLRFDSKAGKGTSVSIVFDPQADEA